MSSGSVSGRWQPAPVALSVFESVAHLYVAADELVRSVVLEAGESWSLDADALETPGVAVWGNTPSNGRSMSLMLRWAARRELSLRRLRSSVGSFAVRNVHRLPPPRRAGRTRNTLRSTLLGGLIVELAAGGRHARVIDAVAAAAGAVSPIDVRLRPSRDGSALARLGGADGVPFELRVAALGGRKEPARNADALTALESAAVALVPRLYGRGEIAGASWTSESVLDGVITRHLTRAIVADVVSLCLQLPRGDLATSLRDRMIRLRDRYPRWGPVATQLAEQATPTAHAVVQHGDLWSGNLLVSGGRLSGVVDWDTWHPAGLPGVDLLHLFSMQLRERTGQDIGALWLSGVWRSPEFLTATSDYWRGLGIRPGPDLLEMIGLDWWAGQVFKRQTFAADPGWVERNIDAVLDAVSGHP